MLVKICAIDYNAKLANVCRASDKISYDNNIGRFLVRWFTHGRRPKCPKLGSTYSIDNNIEWDIKDEKPVIVHGKISGYRSIEEGNRYKI